MQYDLDALTEHEPMPGFHGRFVHTETMTLAFWEIDEGAELPEHSHSQEQVVRVEEGSLELVLGGRPHLLEPGSLLVIPSGVPHSGRAITRCRVLDVFQPTRDDFPD